MTTIPIDSFVDDETFTPEVRRFLSHIGRRGGKVKSARKARQSAANGKLGGRPVKSVIATQLR